MKQVKQTLNKQIRDAIYQASPGAQLNAIEADLTNRMKA